MASPDILFKGIPRGRTRGYTADVIRAVRPEIVVVPCCGSFSLAQVAVEAGIKPEGIVCGDISLYSTALGKAIMDEDWELGVKPEGAEVCEMVSSYLDEGPVGKAAVVFFVLRVLQYNRKVMGAWHRDHQRELLENAGVYMQQIMDHISEVKLQLHGLTYQARDMWETLDEYRDNPDAILLTNPPRYSGGYERMFAGIEAIFQWDEPEVAQFTEADYGRLMELLGESEATTLMYYATQGEDPTP